MAITGNFYGGFFQSLANKELVRNLFLFCYARALRPSLGG